MSGLGRVKKRKKREKKGKSITRGEVTRGKKGGGEKGKEEGGKGRRKETKEKEKKEETWNPLATTLPPIDAPPRVAGIEAASLQTRGTWRMPIRESNPWRHNVTGEPAAGIVSAFGEQFANGRVLCGLLENASRPSINTARRGGPPDPTRGPTSRDDNYSRVGGPPR